MENTADKEPQLPIETLGSAETTQKPVSVETVKNADISDESNKVTTEATIQFKTTSNDTAEKVEQLTNKSTNNEDIIAANEENHMAINLETHQFEIPQKQVFEPEQIADWEKSQAYNDLLGFISAMCQEIKGKKLRDECHISKTVEGLLELLDTMEKWIEECPPVDQPQRFGNSAYKDWSAKLTQNGEDLVRKALDSRYERAVPEITVYLIEGVGNSTRIDYGTGHELSFVAFLCCLFKIGALNQQDSVAVVLRVFNKYLLLMRKLQTIYRMEPAGSQGVWNLDDYQFIPFIWGSAQLIGHQRLSPKSFPDKEICDSYHKDYMFLGCIKYIHQAKTGPFHEHSNQLWNISGVKLWAKVNSGLIKMYKAEVLNKFPVIQHFLFGSLMSCDPVEETQPTVVQSTAVN